MASRTISHQLGAEEARRRIEEKGPSYADKFGLSAGWRAGNVWSGKRAGIQLEIHVGDRSVEVHLDKAFFIPVSESRILNGIASGLEELLA